MHRDALAGSQFGYLTGTAATATVPAGATVVSVSAHVTADGATLTITPKGANQTGTAGDAIPLPKTGWVQFGPDALGAELGPGTIFVFAGTDSYVVVYAKQRAG